MLQHVMGPQSFKAMYFSFSVTPKYKPALPSIEERAIFSNAKENSLSWAYGGGDVGTQYAALKSSWIVLFTLTFPVSLDFQTQSNVVSPLCFIWIYTFGNHNSI